MEKRVKGFFPFSVANVNLLDNIEMWTLFKDNL